MSRPKWQRTLKRLLDVAGSMLLLVMLSPILAAICAGVWISMGRPVFYSWRVVGLGGRPFTGHKFRTMVRDADRMKAALAAQNEMKGPVFKIGNDPRVTPLGRILRKLSLDELPQLWSVLKGDMSLVGPRPPLQSEWPHFEEWQRRKLSVKPGMTCLWQIRGRNEINDFDEWVRLDLEYIDNWSLGLDLKILLLTVPAVVRGRGAR
jgi:lipopolysaccharide/colanic/teichoic acid biosynthesis glycosyltransferase